VGFQKDKSFSTSGGRSSGGFAPLTLHQKLCPWTPLGALSPDPGYGLALRARHEPHLCSPKFSLEYALLSCQQHCKFGSQTVLLQIIVHKTCWSPVITQSYAAINALQ